MSGTDKILDAAYAAFETEAESLRATAGVLDRAEFEKAVSVLASAERIAASGCGHSGIACRHFAHLCCCIERPARFLSPSEAVHGGLGYICGGDVMMLASRGGETDELVPIAKICRAKGATVILVTEKPGSTLGGLSDIFSAFRSRASATATTVRGRRALPSPQPFSMLSERHLLKSWITAAANLPSYTRTVRSESV